eukprot:TRINITY_DN7919_c0_g1_i1.p1 TRINITY_DN7919_c0_g1~~TRINITY_DN7919_c0_g1_i1.p1  ORF type:complete len:466 (-),score=183.44 TRINITY_DN7919_c0_g1_i1:104-1501(-)
MSNWGTELWDQFPEVVNRSDGGKKFCREVAEFFKKRAELEREYAKKLEGLCKGIESDFGTVDGCWTRVKEETRNRSKFHLELAENLKTLVENPITNFIKEKSKQRKKLKENGKKLLGELDRQDKVTISNKQKYEKLRRKQYESKEEYDKSAYNNNNSQKKNLEKKLGTETKTADKADTTYQESIQKQQELEVKCWQTEVPSVISELEEIEKLRIECVKGALENYINLERGFPPLLTEACEKINQLVTSINSSADIQLFVDQKKTGKQKPQLTAYEPYNETLGKCAPKEGEGSFTPNNSNNRISTQYDSLKINNSSTEIENKRNSTPTTTITTSPPPSSSTSNYKGKVRALFDYDSQNEHELSFRQGDIINIIEKDNSGWWNGELNGKIGIFPAAEWVEEIFGDQPTGISGKKCKVVYSYDAQDQDEISISEGEILTISSEDSGWYMGTNSSNNYGRFPSTYVELI